jgi:hypothetical protein
MSANSIIYRIRLAGVWYPGTHRVNLPLWVRSRFLPLLTWGDFAGLCISSYASSKARKLPDTFYLSNIELSASDSDSLSFPPTNQCVPEWLHECVFILNLVEGAPPGAWMYHKSPATPALAYSRLLIPTPTGLDVSAPGPQMRDEDRSQWALAAARAALDSNAPDDGTDAASSAAALGAVLSVPTLALPAAPTPDEDVFPAGAGSDTAGFAPAAGAAPRHPTLLCPAFAVALVVRNGWLLTAHPTVADPTRWQWLAAGADDRSQCSWVGPARPPAADTAGAAAGASTPSDEAVTSSVRRLKARLCRWECGNGLPCAETAQQGHRHCVRTSPLAAGAGSGGVAGACGDAAEDSEDEFSPMASSSVGPAAKRTAAALRDHADAEAPLLAPPSGAAEPASAVPSAPHGRVAGPLPARARFALQNSHYTFFSEPYFAVPLQQFQSLFGQEPAVVPFGEVAALRLREHRALRELTAAGDAGAVAPTTADIRRSGGHSWRGGRGGGHGGPRWRGGQAPRDRGGHNLPQV